MKVTNRVQKSLKFTKDFKNLQKPSKLFQTLQKWSKYPLKVSKYKFIIKINKNSIKFKKKSINLDEENVRKFYNSEYMRMEAVVEVTGGWFE